MDFQSEITSRVLRAIALIKPFVLLAGLMLVAALLATQAGFRIPNVAISQNTLLLAGLAILAGR